MSNNFWAVSNAKPGDLLIWLEPWAEEFRVPSRSFIVFDIENSAARTELPEVELTDSHVAVWANGGDLVKVSIDGTLQDSASARIVVPDFPNLSPKAFLNLAFDKHSAARLGGSTPAAIPSKPT